MSETGIGRMVARVALFAMLAIVAGATGCDSKPATPVVYPLESGDYSFEVDGDQKKVTTGTGFVRIVRSPEDIEVSNGTLRVGPRDYGAVARKDKISVVGGKVAVNGQERRPSTP